jgi:hypothetical protein
MRMIRGRLGRWGGALALIALVMPALPADARAKRRPHGADAAALAPGFSAFTPAASDPRLAAEFARSGLGTTNFAGGMFRFTPSGPASSRRAVTVAVRARAITRQQAARALALPSDGLAPSAYSLGASVGWRRFALSGEVQRTDGGVLPTGRESADVGLSFTGHRWATELELGAERAAGAQLPVTGLDQSWSVGLGGSYSVSRHFNLTGGVRYKQQRDQFQSLTDDRRDSQSVYLGTTFKF